MSNAVVLDPNLPPAWGWFSHLRELTLTGVGLEGSLPGEWSGMINITQLILSDNHKLSGTLPASWASMIELKLLDLSLNYADGLRCGVFGTLPSSWSTMAKLETLNLWRTSVSGHLPPGWAAMKRLQVLSLSDTGISGSIPSAWGSRMPKLATVHMQNTLIGGSLPASWGKMKKLVMLDLRGTLVQQPVPPAWLSLCRRNGTQVWDAAQHANTWPPNLQYGKIARVLFPWASPDGKLWEISHDDASTCNMCHQLASGYSIWCAGALLVCIAAVLCSIVAYRVKSGAFFKLHGQRFD